MNLGQCPRENEVLAQLKSGHWPQSSEPELRDHVAACKICRDTIMIKTAFQGGLAKSKSEARLDTPGIIWWRAQLRRRYIALERVGKPVTFAHLFALATCIVVAVCFAAAQVRNAGGWLSLLDQLKQSNAFHTDVVSSFAPITQDWSLLLLLPCAIAIALMGGIIIYLATDRS